MACLLTFSCSQPNQENNSTASNTENKAIQIPPPPDRVLIDRRDTSCIAEIERAKSDIIKGILAYSLYDRNFKSYDEELRALLKKHNIIYKPLGPNCTGESQCYGLYMDSIITAKHGKAFISRLEKEAQLIYKSSWATRTYDYWHVDVAPTFGNTPPDSFITRKLKFPKGWDFEPMKHERQFMFAEFVVDTLGAVSNIQVANSAYNLKASNEKYLGFFKKEIKNIIEGMKSWKPGEYNSHKVKCWYQVDINLDKENAPTTKSPYIFNKGI